MIKVLDIEYNLIENNKDAFSLEEFTSKYTDYFSSYDFVVGDYAYGKLRLKGFNKKTNKLYNKFNNYDLVKKYIKENCAYECGYFILEKK